ncbi:ADP-ribosylation factor family-domain-containing protein [Tribonema minus]|uniref:ADP-ribosylation factor family-domain-containing protein n=1 Tax=Tribonema minus TaxID=303371 RepID=A0A835Z0A9_9STRA|nr:ADP-ribosylation factor family-domain-containing protein [Tribonema minus]
MMLAQQQHDIGLAGIRQLRIARGAAAQENSVDNSRPSTASAAGVECRPFHRQRRRVEDTHKYLTSKVDPVMSDAITYLLFARPQDVRRAMLDYFVARRAARDNNNRRLSFRELGLAPRAAQKHDRLYMAREIGPVVAHLINAVLRRAPDDVEAFLIGQLQDMLRLPRDGASVPAPPATSRPSTARSRLALAQELDTAAEPLLARSASGKKVTPTAAAAAAMQQQQQAAAMPPPTLAPKPPETAPSLGGKRSSSYGVRESKTEHWDLSVSAAAPVLPPTPLTDAQLTACSGGSGTAAAAAAPPKLACLLLLGLDGSGKTTLLRTLQGDPAPRTQPTVGFAPATLALTPALRVKLYDLGGGARIRGIWQNYFQDCHAVVWMLDASAEGAERWHEARALFLETMAHPYLVQKPVLVLCNKADAGARCDANAAVTDAIKVASELKLADVTSARVARCSAHSAKAAAAAAAATTTTTTTTTTSSAQPEASTADGEHVAMDKPLEAALEWLLEHVRANHGALQRRVAADVADMDAQFEAQKRRVAADVADMDAHFEAQKVREQWCQLCAAEPRMWTQLLSSCSRRRVTADVADMNMQLVSGCGARACCRAASVSAVTERCNTEAKKLSVLRTVLRKAFPADGTAPQDTFPQAEGLDFLASEVGQQGGAAALPAPARRVAALLGYQKLALQMAGNMRAPEDKEIATGGRTNLRFLQFNKLQTSNSLDLQAARAINEVLYKWHDNYMVKAVVLTGARECFCSGADALALRRGGGGRERALQGGGGGGAPAAGAKLRREVARLAYRTRRYPLPLISVVNGAALGGGFALLQSDATIATEDSRFSVPEPLLGQALEGGLSHTLAHLRVGDGDARKPLPGLGAAIALSGITLGGRDMAWAGLACGYADDEELDAKFTMLERGDDIELWTALPMQMRKDPPYAALLGQYRLVQGVRTLHPVEGEGVDDDDEEWQEEALERWHDAANVRDEAEALALADKRWQRALWPYNPKKRARKSKAAAAAAADAAKAAQAAEEALAGADDETRADLETAAAAAKAAAAEAAAAATVAAITAGELPNPDAEELYQRIPRERREPLPVSQVEWTDADAAADGEGIEDSESWIIDTEFGRKRVVAKDQPPLAPGSRHPSAQRSAVARSAPAAPRDHIYYAASEAALRAVRCAPRRERDTGASPRALRDAWHNGKRRPRAPRTYQHRPAVAHGHARQGHSAARRAHMYYTASEALLCMFCCAPRQERRRPGSQLGAWEYVPEDAPEADAEENPLAAWFAFPREPCELEAYAAPMAQCFNTESLQQAVDNVKAAAAEGHAWAVSALQHMQQCSPLALRTVFEQLKRAERMRSLEDCLRMEIVVGDALARQPDYCHEGTVSVHRTTAVATMFEYYHGSGSPEYEYGASATCQQERGDSNDTAWTALEAPPGAAAADAAPAPRWSSSLDDASSLPVDELFQEPADFELDLAGRD